MMVSVDGSSTSSDDESVFTDVSSLTVIAFAEKMQKHGNYINTEMEVKEECERTRGRVQYKPPGRHERNRNLTRKRRREIWKALKQYAENQRVTRKATTHQNEKRFVKAEEKMKEECLATSGNNKVEYESPTSTELAPDTKVRRQRLRRKIHAYYQRRAKVYAVAFAYYEVSQSLTPAHYRWNVLRKTKIQCPLGNDVCPCRGRNWEHMLFTWDRSDDKSFKEETRKYWSKCHACRNGYDTRFLGKFMDLMLSYCNKYVGELHAAVEADKKRFTTGEELVISVSDIGERLLPKLRVFVGDCSGELIAKMRECFREFVTEEHEYFLKDREHEFKATELHLGLVGMSALENAPPSPLDDSCDLIDLLCPKSKK